MEGWLGVGGKRPFSRQGSLLRDLSAEVNCGEREGEEEGEERKSGMSGLALLQASPHPSWLAHVPSPLAGLGSHLHTPLPLRVSGTSSCQAAEHLASYLCLQSLGHLPSRAPMPGSPSWALRPNGSSEEMRRAVGLGGGGTHQLSYCPNLKLRKARHRAAYLRSLALTESPFPKQLYVFC